MFRVLLLIILTHKFIFCNAQEEFILRNTDGSIAFKVNFPERWTSKFDSLPGIHLTLRPSKSSETTNIQFHYQPQSPYETAMERAETMKKHYSVRANSFEVINEKPIQIGDSDAYELTYDISFSSEKTVRILNRYIVENSHFHWLTYIAEPNIFNKLLDEATIIMDSYQTE